MQAVTLDAPSSADAARFQHERLENLVLTRIASSARGAPKTAVSEDLAGFVAHKLSPAQWRQALDALLTGLVRAGFAKPVGVKFEATETGLARVGEFLALKASLPHAWGEVRDTRLMARALGLEKESARRLKALGRPEGLRAAILQRAYALKIKSVATPSRLRAALAAVALDRAFGNRARDSLGDKLGLSAKAGRLLAGQLARKPRDFGTDGRLVAALAAEQVGAMQTDMASLQQAVLRKFLDADAAPAGRAPAPRVQTAQPARPRLVDPPAAPMAPVAAPRPDLPGFGTAIRALAAKDAQGWSGNRKAFISHIWRRLREEHAGWGLSEIEFKCMLAEAHRAGHVALANADLKDASSLKDVQESAVVYKNAVFHFVRVEA